MPLPKIATPTYELVLPSTDETIQFRPFLVKEEKLLVLALESEDNKQITTAIKSVLKNCVLTKGIKVEQLPTFDIEFLFLNIRGKSVGEEVEVLVTCPDDSGTAVPAISAGYDWSTIDDVADTIDETDAYFIGLNWSDVFQADDKIGFAFGQPQKREDETSDPFVWEAYYSFKMNDNVTMTPAVFAATDPLGDVGGETDDVFGAVIETTFKF